MFVVTYRGRNGACCAARKKGASERAELMSCEKSTEREDELREEHRERERAELRELSSERERETDVRSAQ